MPPHCSFSSHTRGASLIDAALGIDSGARAPPPAQPSSPSPAGATSGSSVDAATSAMAAATIASSWTGPVWGSFERNTGTWTPYSASENANIEAAWNTEDPTIDVPTCFNAVVHFNRQGGENHHQMTPAVGSKPPGFRSVLRGTAGQRVTLYWWEDTRLWRLEEVGPCNLAPA